MENVNTWLAAAVAAMSVLAGIIAAARWIVSTMDTRIDARLDARLTPLERRMDGFEVKLEGFEMKLDHITEVVDLRMKPVEEDMALIKRHILGLPAA